MAEEVKIIIDVEAGKSNKTVKEFKKDIEGVGKSAKKMGNDLKVGLDVRQRLRDLQNRMAEIGDVGSKEFQDLAREAGGLKDQMNNANAAIKSMSADFPKLQLGVQGLQAMGAASQATVAAQALLGTENEEVTKSIQKMMALQAVSNSLMQFSNLLSDESALGLAWRKTAMFRLTKQIKAFNLRQKLMNGLMKAFNFITASNPLVKLIVILAAVAAGFVFLASKVKVVKDFFIRLGGEIHNIIEGMGAWKNVILALLGPIGWLVAAWDYFFGEQAAALNDQMKAEQAAFEERTKLGKEAAKQNQERLDALKKEQQALEEKHAKAQEGFDLEIEINKLLGKSTRELTQQKLDDNLAFSQEQARIIAEMIASWTKYYEDLFVLSGKSREDFIAQMKGQGIDLEALLAEAEELQVEANNAIRLNEAKLVDFQLKGAKKVKDGKVKAVKDTSKEIAAAEEKLLQRRIKAQLELDKLEIAAIKDQTERKKAEAVFAFEQSIAKLDENILEEHELIIARELELQEQLTQIDVEAEAERATQVKEKKKEQLEQGFKAAEDLLKTAEALNTIFHGKELKRIEAKKKRGEKLTASEEKRLAKEAKIQKAFALAQIAIDTARAIAGAVAAGSAIPFPGNIPASIAGVAAVMSNIAAASELMSAPPPSVGSAGGGDIAETAAEATQDAPTQALTEGSTLLNEEPQQVVVVESITAGINSVGVIEAQASFG